MSAFGTRVSPARQRVRGAMTMRFGRRNSPTARGSKRMLMLSPKTRRFPARAQLKRGFTPHISDLAVATSMPCPGSWRQYYTFGEGHFRAMPPKKTHAAVFLFKKELFAVRFFFIEPSGARLGRRCYS